MNINDFDQSKPLYALTIGEFIELNKLIFLEIISNNQLTKQVVEKEEEVLNITQASKLVKLAVPTLYSLVSRGQIPYFKISGLKRIYFKRSTLLSWIDEGRRKTNKEMEDDALSYLVTRRKKS